MKIAVAQINTTVGDFTGNAQRIRRAIEAARAAGAGLVVTPELALSGYPPRTCCCATTSATSAPRSS